MAVHLWFAAALFSAAPVDGEPTYNPDPFDDADFGLGVDQPLVVNTNHTSDGRFEVGTLFMSSFIDKYNSHLGLMVDLTYHPIRTLGFSLGFGFLNGSTTSLADQASIERLALCAVPADAGDPASATPGSECDVTPGVPDYEQITGTLDARVIWAPVYGKVNVASEVEANVELYGFLGAGIHGERRPEPVSEIPGTLPAPESGLLAVRIENEGFGDGGLFSDAQAHGSGGVGLKVFFGDVIAFRGELLTLGWRDTFRFRTGDDSFFTYRYFFNAGLSFLL